MADVTRLSPELVRRLRDLARALLVAARSRALYSAEHPAAKAALGRLQAAIHATAGGAAIGFAVMPSTLLVDGTAAPNDAVIAEAAAYLRARDILEISFLHDVAEADLQELLALLASNPTELRERGGLAACWNNRGGHGVRIEQIDVQRVLEDRKVTTPAARDDVWRAIVRGVLERHKVLDDAEQQRLLAIAGDVGAIGELAADVMAAGQTTDGNPMIATQAAAVLAAYRHLSNVVSLLAPERRDEVMGNIAAATARLDPAVTMQILTDKSAAGDGEDGAVITGIVERFDDVKVAQLLATTLAIEGQASQRLASVFDTIAPDDERKRRVLRMTRTMLQETDFGQDSQFDTLWSSMEELLLTHDERPFVSAAYRTALDESIGRAAHLTPDLPPEAGDWLQTLRRDNVRKLSVTLLIDLLNLERDAARAPETAGDVALLAEDLLVEGDYTQARRAVEALAARAADRAAVTSGPARRAVDRMAGSAAVRETAERLDDLNDDDAASFARVAAALGPAVIDPLLPQLAQERETKGQARAFDIVRGFGPAAIGRLGSLVTGAPRHAQRNAARLMGDIGSPEAVPFLQALLHGADPRVARGAVRALAVIDDPSAARAVHAVLRATHGEMRQTVVGALVAERNPRVVPMLLRILGESDVLGGDHPIVLDTLMALGTMGDDLAVNDISRVMRHRSWFRRRRVRALRKTGLLVLRRIGSPAAVSAIQEAASSGDRLLRRMARAVTP